MRVILQTEFQGWAHGNYPAVSIPSISIYAAMISSGALLTFFQILPIGILTSMSEGNVFRKTKARMQVSTNKSCIFFQKSFYFEERKHKCEQAQQDSWQDKTSGCSLKPYTSLKIDFYNILEVYQLSINV